MYVVIQTFRGFPPQLQTSHLISFDFTPLSHCFSFCPPRNQEQGSPEKCLSEKDTMGQEAKSLPEDLYRLHLRLPVLASGTTSDNNPANLARTVRAKPSTSCHVHHRCRGPQGALPPVRVNQFQDNSLLSVICKREPVSSFWEHHLVKTPS